MQSFTAHTTLLVATSIFGLEGAEVLLNSYLHCLCTSLWLMKGYKYAHSYYTSLQCWWPLARGCCPLANKAENIDLKLVWAGGMQTYTHLMGNLGPQLKHGSFTAPRNASQMATGSAMSSTRTETIEYRWQQSTSYCMPHTAMQPNNY